MDNLTDSLRRWGPVLLAAFLMAAAALAAVGCVDTQSDLERTIENDAPLPTLVSGQANGRIPLATLWYSWFGFDFDTGDSIGGLGSTHWNLDAGTFGSEVGVTDEPEYGYYSSDDPGVIAQQLQDMERAGINTIFASWYGWGDDNLDGSIDSPEGVGMHRATKALLDYISATNAPFKVAIAVEPFGLFISPGYTPSSDYEKEKTVVDFLHREIYSVYPDVIFQWEGKDLVIHFLPLDLRNTDDDRFTFKQWGSVPEPDWKEYTNIDWMFHPQVSFHKQISDDGVLLVVPRFDEYWAELMGYKFSYPIRRIDPLLREGFYECVWQVAVDHKREIKLIIVYSWNEHGDHSAIEPTKGKTFLSAGRTLIEKTRRYYERFLSGETIEPYPLGRPETSSSWLRADCQLDQ